MAVATDYNEKLTILKQAIEDNPDDSQCWFEKSEILFELQRLDEALISIEKVLNLCPNNLDAQLLKEKILVDKGSFKIEKQYPKNIFYYYYLYFNQLNFQILEYDKYKYDYEEKKRISIEHIKQDIKRLESKSEILEKAIRIVNFTDSEIKPFEKELSSNDFKEITQIVELENTLKYQKKKLERNQEKLEKLKNNNVVELLLFLGVVIFLTLIFKHIIVAIISSVAVIIWRSERYSEIVRECEAD